MLFLYVLGLLYLTQRVSTQIPSDSEAINKIINVLLSQTEKKNVEKKNPDPLDYLWVARSEKEQGTVKKFKSSMKPIVHNPFIRIDSQRENLNPTLRLQDILPGLRSSYTPSVRNTIKDVDKDITSKETTTPSPMNQSWKMKTDTKPTTTAKKKTKPEKKKLSTKKMVKSQFVKKPVHHGAVYQKEKTVLVKPQKQHTAHKTSTKSNIYYGPYSSATSVTAKDWSGLEYAEDIVKSVPNYANNKPFKDKTTPSTNDGKIVLITTEMTINYGDAVENNFNVTKKQTAATLDKEVEYGEAVHEYVDAKKQIKSKQGINIADDRERQLLRNYLASKYEAPVNNGVLVLKTDAAKEFDKPVNDKQVHQKIDNFNEKYEPGTNATFKYDDPVDINLRQAPVDDIDNKKETLDRLLQKFTETVATETAKNYEMSETLSDTEDITSSTEKTSTDLYLIVEPKDKSLKSYFTLERSTTTDKPLDTTAEVNFDKLLDDLDIKTTSKSTPLTTTTQTGKVTDNIDDVLDNINDKDKIIIEKVPTTSPKPYRKEETTKKSQIADLYKDVVEKYESIKEESKKKHPEGVKNSEGTKNPEGIQEKITKHINWEAIKKFFGHDRVCKCKCQANKTLCTVCAASDAVMRELAFEFTNLADYMNTHCTEIQTFFWMNPTDGKKLRDTVHRIDKTFQDYYKRVRGKCAGRTCKTFSTYLDKRHHSDKNKVRRKYLRELLKDVGSEV